MTAELKKHENNQATYETSLDWDRFEEECGQVFKRNRKRFRIAGFRKGKAPRKVIEAAYGKGVFYEDALNNLLPDLIRSATEELDLEPIGQPEIDVKEIEEGKPIVIEVTTETMPYPELASYDDIEVEVPPIEVTEEEVEEVVNRQRDANAVLLPVEDRPAQEGDRVTIDYKGTKDGEAFEGGTAENQVLFIGENKFIPGFEEGLVGHEAGDSFDLNLTFPEDYSVEDLKGQDVVFHVTLKDIKLKELPEADDEFAQDVSEFDSLEEYKEDIRKKFQDQKKKSQEMMIKDQALSKLVEKSEIEAPQAMLDEQIDTEVRLMANQVQNMGIKFTDYLRYSKLKLEDLKDQVRPRAELKVKGNLALNSLVRDKGFEASQEEIDEEYKKLAEAYKAKDVEAFTKEIKMMGNEKLVEDDVKKQKALDFLADQVKKVPMKKKEDEDKEDQEADSEAGEEKDTDSE